MLGKLPLRVLFLSVVIMVQNQAALAASEELAAFQTPPITLQASKILPPELLLGEHYKIDDEVINDGLVNIYRLTTSGYGTMELKSTAELKIRINEINALQHMQELKKTKVFAKALGKGLKAPLMTAKGLVTRPGKTVHGITTGIGHWFTDIGRSIVKDDPHQEDPIKTAIGYAPAKRAYAYEYGVDPYSAWPPVQEELEKIAWTAVGGGLTPKVAFGLIKKPAGMALRVTGTADSMKKLVRDKSPAQLEKINHKKLQVVGVPEHLRKTFLANPYYGPQGLTLLAGGLENLGTCKNVEVFVGAAALVNGPSTARFMSLRAQLIGEYAVNVLPAQKLIEADGIAFLMRFDGTVVGLFPLDHVVWTATLANKEKVVSAALKQISDVTGKEIWVTGTVDPLVRRAFEFRGWKIEENAWDKLKKKN